MLYELLKHLFFVTCCALFGVRAYGTRRLPRTGGFVLASNHQSFLDPILLGIAIRRRIGFVARSTLFRIPIFGWIIRQVGAVPIDRDRGDMAALRGVKQALRDGRVLVMFPEGTRSRDGEIGRCKAGAVVTARAAKAPIVFAAVDGTFRAWPRNRLLPRPFRRIRVLYGEPVTFERGGAHGEMGAEVRARLVEVREELRHIGPRRG